MIFQVISLFQLFLKWFLITILASFWISVVGVIVICFKQEFNHQCNLSDNVGYKYCMSFLLTS